MIYLFPQATAAVRNSQGVLGCAEFEALDELAAFEAGSGADEGKETGIRSRLATADVAELVLSVTRLSRRTVVPSITLTRTGHRLRRA